MKEFIKNKLIDFGIRVERAWIANNRIFFLQPTYDMLINHLIHQIKDPMLVVIGANDGVYNDPLYFWIKEYNLRAILVEPQPDVFSKLVKNYEWSSNVILENCCISDQTGEVDFFCLKKNYALEARSSLKRQSATDRASSLDLNHLLQFVGYSGDWRDIIEKISVPSMTLEDLLNKYQVEQCDLLQIDAEGCDLEILKTLDNQLIRPSIICYEFINLSDEDYSKSLSLIINWGYKWAQEGYNVIAQYQGNSFD